jgi:hypothetical protein
MASRFAYLPTQPRVLPLPPADRSLWVTVRRARDREIRALYALGNPNQPPTLFNQAQYESQPSPAVQGRPVWYDGYGADPWGGADFRQGERLAAGRHLAACPRRSQGDPVVVPMVVTADDLLNALLGNWQGPTGVYLCAAVLFREGCAGWFGPGLESGGDRQGWGRTSRCPGAGH